MKKPETPSTETRRLSALRDLAILDTPPEPAFDDIVRIASAVCGVPMALVSLVDEDRQWFKAKIGLDVNETQRDIAFCAHAILDDDLFVVHDARRDERFSDNPLVTGAPHIAFYAGAPLTLPGGDRVGTLCLLDERPRALTDEMRDILLGLKRQVEAQLAVRAHATQLARVNDALVALQIDKERLVQFVVHDMRGSLSSVQLNADLLVSMMEPSSEEAAVASEVLASAAALDRMIADVLDIGTSELGAPMRVHPQTLTAGSLFTDVARMFAIQVAEKNISLVHTGDDVVLRADGYLLKRVLENLVSNALRLAPQSSAIELHAERRGAVVRLLVTDQGPGIPDSQREAIFDLYTSGHASVTNHGIGLAFCRAAMSAQGGSIDVESSGLPGARFAIEVAVG